MSPGNNIKTLKIYKPVQSNKQLAMCNMQWARILHLPIAYCPLHIDLRSSHFSQVRSVRNDRMAHLRKFSILYSVFQTGLLDYFTDGRVVDMRNFRK